MALKTIQFCRILLVYFIKCLNMNVHEKIGTKALFKNLFSNGVKPWNWKKPICLKLTWIKMNSSINWVSIDSCKSFELKFVLVCALHYLQWQLIFGNEREKHSILISFVHRPSLYFFSFVIALVSYVDARTLICFLPCSKNHKLNCQY